MAPFGNQNSKGKGVTTASTDPNGGPSKRTLQNRKAQREFRKRREARVRELEERCRRYDELCLEANVELQRVARRLKDENDALRNLIVNLGHGKLIPAALEGVYQQPQTPGGSAGTTQLFGHGLAMDAGPSSKAMRPSTSSSSTPKSIKAATTNGNGGSMGPPLLASNGQRGIAQMSTTLTSASLEPTSSAQSNASSSVTRGDEQHDPHTYNPPELLQRSALSNPASLLAKFGPSGMVGIESSSGEEDRTSANMSQHINADSRTGSVPSLLRLDLSGSRTSAGMGAAPSPLNGGNAQRPQVKVKQELVTPQQIMRPGNFASMGVPIPAVPAPTSTSTAPSNGPIVSYNGVSSAFLPFVQPTSVNEALLNPNPIPFQFNLSQLSQPPSGISPMQPFSSLLEQNAWWLGTGGPSALTPGQDPNALDEKAQAVAEQQQLELARSGSLQAAGTTDGSGTTGSGGGAQQSPFDLSAFLNGGVTPGGSFKMDGSSAISEQTSNVNQDSNQNSPRRASHSPSADGEKEEASKGPTTSLRGEDGNASSSATEATSGRRNIVGDIGRTGGNDSASPDATISSSQRRASSSAVSDSALPPNSDSTTQSTLSADKDAQPSSSSPLDEVDKADGASPSSSSTRTGGSPPLPAINAAKQLLLDGAVGSAAFNSVTTNPTTSLPPTLASLALSEGYPSMNIPLKRSLSNALGTPTSSNAGSLAFGASSPYADGAAGASSPSAFVPPTKIFRAATPGTQGAMPLGLDNADSTRALLALLERRMAAAVEGAGGVGGAGGAGGTSVYEYLGFRPPSFVAGAADAASDGRGPNAATATATADGGISAPSSSQP